MSELDNLIKQLSTDRIPLKELVYSGRTQDIIDRYAEREAKALIMQERNREKRHRLIAMHLPLFK